MIPGFVRGRPVHLVSLLNRMRSWSAAGVVVILNVSPVLPEETTGTVCSESAVSVLPDVVGGGGGEVEEVPLSLGVVGREWECSGLDDETPVDDWPLPIVGAAGGEKKK